MSDTVERCPSCNQPVAATDLLCTNCELILDSTQVRAAQGSVVRRMLEAPQPGLPAERPRPPSRREGEKGEEGPTRRVDVGAELPGVPVVVATLKSAPRLSEFEAWVVSLIDGECNPAALAEKLALRELELRVVLRTLQEKQVIEFASRPLRDTDPELPVFSIDDDGPPLEASPPAPPPASLTSLGVTPPMLPYPGSMPRSARVPNVPPMLKAAAQLTGVEPQHVPSPSQEVKSDPRIAHAGIVNRKVLDALKKVKRIAPAPGGQATEESGPTLEDLQARETLQIALRMEQGGRLDEAIRYLEKSIAQSPQAPALYNRLGIILMRERGDYRRAEELIRRATELAPGNAVYLANLRQVLSQQALRAQR